MAALQVLSAASSDIIESEVYQLELLQKKSYLKKDYFRLIEGKTAKLFAAAMESGAIVATDDKGLIQKLKAYGLNLGMAFQIMDDFLDYFPGGKSFGKVVGNDFIEGKITLPAIYAIEENKKLIKFFKQETRSQKCFEDFMSQIDEGVLSEKIEKDLGDFTKVASQALSGVKASGIKDALVKLIEELNFRKV